MCPSSPSVPSQLPTCADDCDRSSMCSLRRSAASAARISVMSLDHHHEADHPPRPRRRCGMYEARTSRGGPFL